MTPASAQRAAVLRLAALGRPIYCGGGAGRLVALTFDDGPGPYTGVALKELRRAHAQATFFLVARSIDHFPGWDARERRLAALGDHTATHPFLPGLPPGAAAGEIAAGRDAILRTAGGPVDLFRPPYGGHTPAIDAEVRRQRMAEILWSLDSGDSLVAPPQDYRAISATVRRFVRPGSIVLLHENRGQTIRALRSILPALRRRRLRAVTVPELLAADPPSIARLGRGSAGCGRTHIRGAGG
jgi:peptidoglycan/xylan/chitin deacetylase (PgdA/CDA1 family)